MAKPKHDRDAVMRYVCDQMALGRSVRSILKEKGMPAMSNFFVWLRDDEALQEQYARACEARGAYWGDTIMDLSDPARVELLHEDPKIAVQLAKLQTDNAKWVASRLSPKRYSERVVNEMIGNRDEDPIQIDAQVVDDREAARRIAFLLERAQRADK
jgi:hypothetical protein